MKALSFLILLTTTILANGQGSVQFDVDGHKVLNQQAPNFKALTLDGTEINLADMKGKIVLVNFWSLSCSACFKELPELNGIAEKYSKEAFVLISLMDNTKEALLKKFDPMEGGYKMKKSAFGNDRIDFQIIPDAKEIMKQFSDHLGFPRVFIIDPQGIVSYHQLGYAEDMGVPDGHTTVGALTKEINRLLATTHY